MVNIVKLIEAYKIKVFKHLEKNISMEAPGFFLFSLLFILSVGYWWVRDVNLSYVSWTGPVTSIFDRPYHFLNDILDNLIKPGARLPLEGWSSFYRGWDNFYKIGPRANYYCENYITSEYAEERMDSFIGCFMSDPVSSVWYNLQDMVVDIGKHGFDCGFVDFLIQGCLIIQLFWYFYEYNLPTSILLTLNCQLATVGWMDHIHYQALMLAHNNYITLNYSHDPYSQILPDFRDITNMNERGSFFSNYSISEADFRLAMPGASAGAREERSGRFNTFEYVETVKRFVERTKDKVVEMIDYNTNMYDDNEVPAVYGHHVSFEPYHYLIENLMPFIDRWTEMRVVVDENYVQYVKFHIDPISLFLVKYGLFESNPVLRNVHLIFYEVLGPTFTVVFTEIWYKLFILIVYAGIMRRFKNILSYLVRWHFTTAYLLDQTLAYPLGFLVRLNEALVWKLMCITQQVYQITHESPYALTDAQSLEAIEDLQNDIIFYITAQSCIILAFYSLFVFFILAALHAACGQYFYIPWLTLNVELQCGPRGKVTIYNSGLMDWQKYAYADRTFSWYGLFGRGRDKESILSIIFDFIKSRLIKLFKKFMSFFRDD